MFFPADRVLKKRVSHDSSTAEASTKQREDFKEGRGGEQNRTREVKLREEKKEKY